MTNPDGGGNRQPSLEPPAAVQDHPAMFVPEPPPQKTLLLWNEVAYGIDKNQTGKLSNEPTPSREL